MLPHTLGICCSLAAEKAVIRKMYHERYVLIVVEMILCPVISNNVTDATAGTPQSGEQRAKLLAIVVILWLA